MKKIGLIILATLSVSTALVQTAIACSFAPVDEPSPNLGFDSTNSPAEPTQIELQAHTEESSGCGSMNSCDGTVTLTGQFESAEPIVLVGVTRDGFEQYGNVVSLGDDFYEFTIIGADDAVDLRFYNAAGYHSDPMTVDVSDSSAGCFVGRKGRTSAVTLFLIALVLVSWRRRRTKPLLN